MDKSIICNICRINPVIIIIQYNIRIVCPGGFCPGGFVEVGIVLESLNAMIISRMSAISYSIGGPNFKINVNYPELIHQ